MKKQVEIFVKSLGGNTRYSGNLKTMFINGPDSIEAAVVEKFGYGLEFTLKTNKHNYGHESI